MNGHAQINGKGRGLSFRCHPFPEVGYCVTNDVANLCQFECLAVHGALAQILCDEQKKRTKTKVDCIIFATENGSKLKQIFEGLRQTTYLCSGGCELIRVLVDEFLYASELVHAKFIRMRDVSRIGLVRFVDDWGDFRKRRVLRLR